MKSEDTDQKKCIVKNKVSTQQKELSQSKGETVTVGGRIREKVVVPTLTNLSYVNLGKLLKLSLLIS